MCESLSQREDAGEREGVIYTERVWKVRRGEGMGGGKSLNIPSAVGYPKIQGLVGTTTAAVRSN